MKFLKNLGLSFFLLIVLLLFINAVIKNSVKNTPEKPVMTSLTETVRPAAEAYSKFTEKKFLGMV